MAWTKPSKKNAAVSDTNAVVDADADTFEAAATANDAANTEPTAAADDVAESRANSVSNSSVKYSKKELWMKVKQQSALRSVI